MPSAVVSRVRQAAPWLVLGLAAILLVMLGTQTRALRRDVRRLEAAQHLLHAGEVVPAVRVPGLRGDSVTLGGGPDAVHVLFVLSTTCPYCEATLALWDTIAGRLVGAPGVAVYGVSLDPDSATVPWVARHGIRFPVVRFARARDAGTYRAIGSPITLVLDSSGTVRYARGSVLTPAAADSVVKAALAVPSVSRGGR